MHYKSCPWDLEASPSLNCHLLHKNARMYQQAICKIHMTLKYHKMNDITGTRSKDEDLEECLVSSFD